MPIFETGYRDWEGARRGALTRAWCITRSGVRLAYRNAILRKIFYFVYAPLLYFVPLFFAIGSVTDPVRGANLSAIWNQICMGLFGREVTRMLIENPEVGRPAAWSLAFFIFFSYVQMFVAMIVVAFVGPPLICRDIRTKGYLVYFAKPITVGEYLLGKGGVVVSYVFLVTLVPALLLYAISIAYSPSLGALLDTWDIVVRIFAASVVFAIPTALFLLLLSAVVPEVRYAAFTWIAVCVFGNVAYRALLATPGLHDAGWIFLLSPREILVTAYERIFDLRGSLEPFEGASRLDALRAIARSGNSAVVAMGALAAISVGSLLLLRRRVAGLLRG